MPGTVPKATALRLSLYLRGAEALDEAGESTVSSQQLASRLGLTATQVRKDLAHFGQFGRPGVGYDCRELIERLRQIIGTDRVRPVALIGCGNLGRALANYHGFERRGFHIAAVFDNDLRKVGLTVGGHRVLDTSELAETCRREKIRLAVLAVPEEAAQAVANRLVEARVEGILNFAPVRLDVPPEIVVSNVSLSIELEQLGLAARLKHGTGESEAGNADSV